MQCKQCSPLCQVLVIYSGVARAPGVLLGQGGPQTYRIPKFVAGSFGLDPLFPTEGGILGPCFR